MAGWLVGGLVGWPVGWVGLVGLVPIETVFGISGGSDRDSFWDLGRFRSRQFWGFRAVPIEAVFGI